MKSKRCCPQCKQVKGVTIWVSQQINNAGVEFLDKPKGTMLTVCVNKDFVPQSEDNSKSFDFFYDPKHSSYCFLCGWKGTMGELSESKIIST